MMKREQISERTERAPGSIQNRARLAIACGVALFLATPGACSEDDADPVKPAELDHGERAGEVGVPLEREPSQTPIPGVDTSALDKGQLERWYTLAERLSSPCQKPHSLRHSLTQDAECKRAPFAARYVVMLVADGVDDDGIATAYRNRYGTIEPQKFERGEQVPHKGPVDAPVVMVEFYDYGCPRCKQAAPAIEQMVKHFDGEVVIYYRQFPLPSHPNSRYAARAAVAAHAQGKFAEMHAKLFDNAPRHQESEVMKYAEELGLDMKRFKADFDAATQHLINDQVAAIAAKVNSTPTLFIDGRRYYGPYGEGRYLTLWLEEEVALNR